ncbi:MAG TPA: hypothetical protein VNY27_00725 [Solirubrobacteraceae bacterium]|jgi:hypothetical protein|nr:hypothetical protein [Solirubrobacteraceae bacterium]
MRIPALLRLLPLVATALLVLPVAAGASEVKPFGIEAFSLQTTGPAREVTKYNPGSSEPVRQFVNEPYSFTQAAGHPYALTTRIQMAGETITESAGKSEVVPTRDPKDLVVNLPAGLLGDPQALPRCPLETVTDKSLRCPADTQVGVVVLHLLGGTESIAPIVNLTPEAGQSAEFGLETAIKLTYLLTAHVVRSGSTYGLTVASTQIPVSRLTFAELTFWGVPAEPSHDAQRGLVCENTRSALNGGALGSFCDFGTGGLEGETSRGGLSAGVPEVPFLTLPVDCSAGVGARTAVLRGDSWEEPGTVREGRYTGYTETPWVMPRVTGCDRLQFGPSIEVQPDTLLADAPVGLGVTVDVPQNLSPVATATPELRDAVVTLPEGLSISPGIVDGIQACNATGPEGINIPGLAVNPEVEENGPNGELQLAPGKCPNASTVGTAEAVTPLLPEPVRGHVYLARPGCGGAGQAPCTTQDALDGNLYKLYLELGGVGPLANAGVNLKVEGEVEANPATGQLTTKFLQNPQFPFSELHINLNGGPRAPLDTPAACGPATTTADFTPWSAPGLAEGVPFPGTPDGTPSSFFSVGGCASPPGLNPGFTAGTVSPQAGAFSAFTLNFSRQDREQFLSGIQVHTPPGLLGMLSSVPLCGEPQAQQGTCPEASKIGTTRVASGAGSHPFEVGGNVYLTTGYKGAPFGLSIVTNAVAGPFNLGLVVVRSRIDVDPVTSQLTVTSDPLPQIIFGVPLRLQRVTVNIDRPNFMFNPTNCSAQQITAVVTGSQQAVANVASPFAAGGCRSLDFKPSFTVSTSGHTSKAGGASLDAKVTYPAFKAGSEANIAYVKVELPKQLPSRLTTLQKACPDATFNANPAGCPSASIIGIVRTSTPLLPVGLEGPVYFVSHGGEAFPSLIAVLQGDGVRVDLTGTTFISKSGITSSTFKTVPDVPVNTFEIYLPEGKFSALAANGNLCKSKLVMPTEFVAQNGAVMKQSTKVSVTACPKAKKAKKKRRARKARVASHRNGRAGR